MHIRSCIESGTRNSDCNLLQNYAGVLGKFLELNTKTDVIGTNGRGGQTKERMSRPIPPCSDPLLLYHDTIDDRCRLLVLIDAYGSLSRNHTFYASRPCPRWYRVPPHIDDEGLTKITTTKTTCQRSLSRYDYYFALTKFSGVEHQIIWYSTVFDGMSIH